MAASAPRAELDLSRPISVAHQLKLSGTSILDSTFVDAKSKRALYTSTTHDGATTLLRLDEHDQESTIGEVWWEGGRGSHKGPQHAMIVLHGHTMRFEEFLRKSTGFLKNKAQIFQCSGMQCQWRRGASSSPVYPAMRTYHCQLTSYTLPPSYASRMSSTRSTVSMERMVALFTSPIPGQMNPELLIYDAGAYIMDEVMITCIMTCANKLEWREVDTVERLRREGHASSQLAIWPSRSQSLASSRLSESATHSSVTESLEEASLPPAYLRTVPAGQHRVTIAPASEEEYLTAEDALLTQLSHSRRDVLPSYGTQRS